MQSTEGQMRREQLGLVINAFKGEMQAALPRMNPAWYLLPSDTAIQPLLVGDNSTALALADGLRQAGFWVSAIRPPTVPVGTARLRFTLSAAHELDDVAALIQALQKVSLAL
jgi:8-amino-7-oxononanoate synthase